MYSRHVEVEHDSLSCLEAMLSCAKKQVELYKGLKKETKASRAQVEESYSYLQEAISSYDVMIANNQNRLNLIDAIRNITSQPTENPTRILEDQFKSLTEVIDLDRATAKTYIKASENVLKNKQVAFQANQLALLFKEATLLKQQQHDFWDKKMKLR